MACAGLTDELKELFDSVAEDLGWLNIDEAEKNFELNLKISTTATDKTKHKSRKVKKVKKKDDDNKKTTRRRKKSSRSSEDTCCPSDEKLNPGRREPQESSLEGFRAFSLDLLTNNDDLKKHSKSTNSDSRFPQENPRVNGHKCLAGNKDVRTSSSNLISTDEAANDDDDKYSRHIDDTVTRIPQKNIRPNGHIDKNKVFGALSLDPLSNDEADRDDDDDDDDAEKPDLGDSVLCTRVPQQSPKVNGCTDRNNFNESSSDPLTITEEAVNDGEEDDLTSNDEAKHPRQSDSEIVFSLTDRLLNNHKSKQRKVYEQNDSKNNIHNSHNVSKPKDFVVISDDESEGEDKENESTRNSCNDKSSFKEYRNVETPRRGYISSSSDDDDDKFESFLASMKSSSQTPAEPPPSQDEIDDFIADDDEPILISSDEEVEDVAEKELFYYQYDNAEAFPEEEGESASPVFSTPLERPLEPKKIKKPLSSFLQEEDSDDSDEFLTPMEQALKPQNFKKQSSKHLQEEKSDDDSVFFTPLEKSVKPKHFKKPPSNFVQDEEANDFVFLTPSVRPPLKPKNFKKPPNTLPAKPSRPVLTEHNKPHGHGIRSTPSFLASLATPVKGELSTSPYVRDFKKNKEALTTKLFKLYNETVFDNKLPSDLSITWNKRLRKTAGYCYYSKRKVDGKKQSRLELSEKVCDSAERLRDTLIHELCHAAAWLVHGVHDGHGRFWKYWAAKANIAHPEIPMIKRCHSYEINTKYKYKCTRCSTTIGRHSKSINTEKFCCAYCKGQLVLLPTTNKDGTPAKTRTPNKFAMFVKENYASAKKDNAQLKHADIMRLLSKDFAGKAKIAE